MYCQYMHMLNWYKQTSNDKQQQWRKKYTPKLPTDKYPRWQKLCVPLKTNLYICGFFYHDFFSLLQCVLILNNITVSIIDYKFTKEKFLKPTFNSLFMQTAQQTYNLKEKGKPIM